MIKINYSRRSVCMGDDINPGNYILSFKETATLKDLLDKITSVKFERSLAFTGPRTHWIIKSNIGDLAEITVDKDYKWMYNYLSYNSNTKLKDLKIDYISGE